MRKTGWQIDGRVLTAAHHQGGQTTTVSDNAGRPTQAHELFPHAAAIKNWLAGKFLEKEKTHQIVRKYTDEGEPPVQAPDTNFAPLAIEDFHSFLHSIGAHIVSSWKGCQDAGWVAKAERFGPDIRASTKYCLIWPAVLDERQANHHSDSSQVAKATSHVQDGEVPGRPSPSVLSTQSPGQEMKAKPAPPIPSPLVEPVFKQSTPWPLVGEKTGRRGALPELADDDNRDRQSRYCQGFDPDWWLPALLSGRWRTHWYPREMNRESVNQWMDLVDCICVEYLGPFDMPDRAAELQSWRDNDLALIREYAPHLIAPAAPPQQESVTLEHKHSAETKKTKAVDQERELRDAICDAFSMGDLTQLVRHRLGETLEEIVKHDSLQSVAFEVINFCRRRGRLEFPMKSGQGVNGYSACSNCAGETYPRAECRRWLL
jgi:hypothetical protein